MEAAGAIPCHDSLCQGQAESAELQGWVNQSGSTWAPHPLPSQSRTQVRTVKQLKKISATVKKTPTTKLHYASTDLYSGE